MTTEFQWFYFLIIYLKENRNFNFYQKNNILA